MYTIGPHNYQAYYPYWAWDLIPKNVKKEA